MAQKLEQGSFAVLNGVKLVNTEMEFVSVHGMSEADFSEYEKDWKEDKPQIVDFFITRANIPLEGLVILGSFPKAAYTLKVTVNAISEKGNYDCDVTLLDAGMCERRNVGDQTQPDKGRCPAYGKETRRGTESRNKKGEVISTHESISIRK